MTTAIRRQTRNPNFLEKNIPPISTSQFLSQYNYRMHSAKLTTPAPTEIELSRRSQCQDDGSSSRDEEGQVLTETVTYPVLSRWKTVTIISTVSGITVLNSMQNGIVTVGLPTIGRDLGLNPSLILWYVTPIPGFLMCASLYRLAQLY